MLPIALLAWAVASAAAATVPKHILFFIIDDLGFSDVSYRAATVPELRNMSSLLPPTPRIDALALAGVRLEGMYTHPLCSPSRGALASGRYAYTTGGDSEVIVDGQPDSLPTNIRTVADLLQGAGFRTSAYGKWDMGMTTWGCTPTCRGFGNFSGFYNAFNAYFTHEVGGYLDLRHDTRPDVNQSGVYETTLITSRVVEWAAATIAANASARTFAYVAHQAQHAPQQVPASYLARCSGIPATNPLRVMSCAQMTAVDDSVGAIVDEYRRLGILDDTLIAFTSDNGANIATGGSAWPLRGMKATVWEGGSRATAFISGAGIDPAVRGTASYELYSIADWLPTLAGGIAGVDLAQAALPKHPYQAAPPPLDGVDAWASMSGGLPSPRTELLITLDPFACMGDKRTPCLIPGQGAYRSGKYKLVYGHTSTYSGPTNTTSGFCGQHNDDNEGGGASPLPVPLPDTPPFCPTGWVLIPGSGGAAVMPPPEIDCPEPPCLLFNSTLNTGFVGLYDIAADPYEMTNLAASQPGLVAQLLAKLQAINNTRVPQSNSAQDPNASPARFGGVWTPWRGNPDPAVCDPNTTVPWSALHGSFDGVVFAKEGGAVSGVAQGWAWDGAQDGGRTQLNVSLAFDDEAVALVLADVDRPNLPNRTGAPDPYHGFTWTLPPALAAKAAKGKHHFSASVPYAGDGDAPIDLSPRCYDDGAPVTCPPGTGIPWRMVPGSGALPLPHVERPYGRQPRFGPD